MSKYDTLRHELDTTILNNSTLATALGCSVKDLIADDTSL